jgi:uncharacterized protein involved in response to NO
MDTVRSAAPSRGNSAVKKWVGQALRLSQRAPRPLQRFSAMTKIRVADLAREPFRIFFPAAVLAGILGVALWPIYFTHLTQFYPGTSHPRIMAFGFFGGFILGFLGTAMPRMLSTNPLRLREAFSLLFLHLAMVGAFLAGNIVLGDILFLALLCLFAICMVPRACQRKDNPPPGFVLVGLTVASVATGAVLAIIEHYSELDLFWIALERLLCYQAFVLLPILGIGPFLLPRFFGQPTPHDFPEALTPNAPWLRKAALALSAGALILGSFLIEASGWFRIAYALRFATTLAYFLIEMPFHRGPAHSNALGASIRISLAGILAGFLAICLLPAYRVALLHLTLIGGFAVITLTVATRVLFGHSGNLALLRGRNRWLLIAVGMMLFGMATRISGDFWLKILPSHYIYGALLWIAGVCIWSYYALPKIFTRDIDP